VHRGLSACRRLVYTFQSRVQTQEDAQNKYFKSSPSPPTHPLPYPPAAAASGRSRAPPPQSQVDGGAGDGNDASDEREDQEEGEEGGAKRDMGSSARNGKTAPQQPPQDLEQGQRRGAPGAVAYAWHVQQERSAAVTCISSWLLSLAQLHTGFVPVRNVVKYAYKQGDALRRREAALASARVAASTGQHPAPHPHSSSSASRFTRPYLWRELISPSAPWLRTSLWDRDVYSSSSAASLFLEREKERAREREKQKAKAKARTRDGVPRARDSTSTSTSTREAGTSLKREDREGEKDRERAGWCTAGMEGGGAGEVPVARGMVAFPPLCSLVSYLLPHAPVRFQTLVKISLSLPRTQPAPSLPFSPLAIFHAD